MSEKYCFETLQIHAGLNVNSQTNSRALPIYQTSSYLFNDSDHARALFSLEQPGNIYTRLMNPTTSVLEERLSALEGGVGALAVASGMAAITYALQNVAQSGDEIITLTTLYGGTHTLLNNRFEKQFGIKVKFIEPENFELLELSINEKTRAIFFETIGNPDGNIPDFERIIKIAKAHGVPVIVDNTFGTPYLINLKSLGANIVVHSLTKYIGGHGTSIGGAIVDLGNFDWKSERFPHFNEPDSAYHDLVYSDLGASAYIVRARVALLRDTGACLSPFNSFLFAQGLETLSLRVERHCQNAIAVANFLENHPKVEWVSYSALPSSKYYERAKKYLPKGSGAIFSFGIKGGLKSGKTLIDNLKLFSLVANVADAKSLIIHPASTTHAQLSEDAREKAGVKNEMLRISIGLENVDDLIFELNEALKKC